MEIIATNVFERTLKGMNRINILRGGSRSSKTFSMIQIAVVWLFTGRVGSRDEPHGTFVITRSTFPALRTTVMKELIDFLKSLNLYDLVDHSRTTHTLRFQRREIVFFSVDDEQKLRGQASVFAWLNEANSFKMDQFNQLVMRCTGCIFIDFNPTDCWIRPKLEEQRFHQKKDVNIVVSTYKDNPFLSDEQRSEIENLINVDPDLYKIYCLGEYGILKGRIYPEWNQVDQLPVEWEKRYFGLDFGWANAPTAMVEIREHNGEIFIRELLYHRDFTNDDIMDHIGTPAGRVIADSASPKDIEILRRNGWNIKPSKKGRDSVVSGIMLLKSKKIHITSDSLNLIRENNLYKWKLNDMEEPINEPLKQNDHLMDAIRYAIQYHSTKSKITLH